MELELKGKHALITGGSQGIGHAIARRLAGEGCDVTIVGRDVERLKRAEESLRRDFKVKVASLSADLAQYEQLQRVFPLLRETDILINSAGAVPRGALLETKSEILRDAFAGKVFATMDLCREAQLRMRERNGGVVVNIIGIAGEKPNPRSIGTTTANAALIAFTEAAGAISVDDKVRIVGINPGLIATERTKSLLDKNNAVDSAAYAQLVKTLPYGRMGEPDEIADLAAFLASPRASYISGAVFTVDAGSRYRT